MVDHLGLPESIDHFNCWTFSVPVYEDPLTAEVSWLGSITSSTVAIILGKGLLTKDGTTLLKDPFIFIVFISPGANEDPESTVTVIANWYTSCIILLSM